jgi:urease accessory protein
MALTASPAFAHLNPAEHGSFAAGFTHPISGADHILAMVAVGLWAAMLGGRALFAVPAAFVGVMLLGFVAALAGVPVPFVEPVILASVVVIGLLVALALPVSAVVGAMIVGFFAFFHGHAHGGEIGGAAFLSYGAGFALATILLHAAGIGVGLTAGRMMTRKNGRIALRVAGGATALGGIMLMAG